MWSTHVDYSKFIGITVRFDNASYSIDENVGIVQPLLVLSNPSSFVETVQVINTDITAIGMEYRFTFAFN